MCGVTFFFLRMGSCSAQLLEVFGEAAFDRVAAEPLPADAGEHWVVGPAGAFASQRA